MHSHWNGYPPLQTNPSPSANTQPLTSPVAQQHEPNLPPYGAAYTDSFAIMHLASRMDYLIRLMEENNKLLRSLEQQQNRVVTSGGGSVIVRM
ncbi:hypothetical protein [Paenibacillus kobensis]|uniref:hypothetical protein n=1 Tax=Paenibacillus kobensis TaxID=59841 RepID=UPI000FDA7D1E|nr:hypothetical protein [Paenibacillus kobensis]